MKNKILFFLALFGVALLSPFALAAPATDAQKNAFLEIMNADPQTGEYKANISVTIPDGKVKMTTKAHFDAIKKQLLADVSMNAELCVTELGCVDALANGKLYADETSAAMNVKNISLQGNDVFADALESELPELNTWLPVPDAEYEIVQNLMFSPEKTTKEDIKNLKVKERKNFAQYDFTTEDEDIFVKGVIKVYKNGKQQLKIFVTPSQTAIKNENFDFLDMKMDVRFSPKKVSIVKPY